MSAEPTQSPDRLATFNAVVRELQDHLERIHRDARGDLEAERRELYLLALEREGLAAIGYGGETLQTRIAQLDAPEEVRALVAHALRWASRDERTHAVLARGLLFARRQWLLAIKTIVTDLAGLIAGWSSAVLQHTRFRKAPLSTCAAFVIAQLGRVAGKVPKTAESTLRSQRFLEFCQFQADAEETAALSWERIAALAGDDGRAITIATMIAKDERKHREIFGVLLQSFDAEDRLLPGRTAEAIAAEMARIDPSFLPLSFRPDPAKHNSVGRGGPVIVRESSAHDPESLRKLLRSTLLDTGLLPKVFKAGTKGCRVAVKTTFMMAYDRRDPSPHVDFALARELALMLRAHGATDVAFLESPNQYDHYFGGRSVAEVAAYLGFEDDSFRIVDTSKDQVPHTFRRGIGQDSVSATWRDADLRLCFGKMRSNPSWLADLSLNTLSSLGKRVDELLFAERQADLLSGLMMLLDELPPHLSIIDATHHVPDGLTGILGDPQPCHPGRIYAAEDPLALDFVAARHMGLHRFPDRSAVVLAADWFADPRSRTTVDGIDTSIKGFKSPHRNDATVLLSALAYPVYAYAGERGGYWLPVMDPRAFPSARRATISEAIVRPILRGIFGFGRPPSTPTAAAEEA